MHIHLRDARIRAAKIREIDENRTRFIGRIDTIRTGMDPQARPTSGDTLDQDFRDLERRLREATDLRSRRNEITKQIDAETKNESAQQTSLEKANAQLESLRVQAGVASLDAISKAIQDSRKRATVSDRVAALEKILAENLRGESMAEFCAAAREHGAGIESTLLSLRDDEKRLDDEISAAEKLAEAAKTKLAEYQRASDRAAEARQQASLVASKLQDLTVEYAAIHLARLAIDKAKEQYRQKNQDNMLTKAGNFFRTLTDGAFAGLEIDNEEGKDVLKAVRSETSRPDPRVSVNGLSDGTRDQLFLALRLAGIEGHIAEREPFPLIVDDALINFDDKRTRSTLACLAELAKKTQVLVFTHHRHLVDFALEVDPTAGIHELG